MFWVISYTYLYMDDLEGIAFDLDETLTKSKEPLDKEVSALLEELSQYLPIAVVSGATRERIGVQVVEKLAASTYPKLTLCPTSGAALYMFNGKTWEAIYENNIARLEAKRIEQVILEIASSSKLLPLDTVIWGPQIEFRGSQVTFSALGQNAPYDAKIHWDADKSKRLHLRELIASKLPDYDIAIGGTTSIDVVQKGINKAYGVTKFAEHIGVPIENILYVGDDLAPGGNDYVVAEKTKARTHPVTGPADTALLIKNLLLEFKKQ